MPQHIHTLLVAAAEGVSREAIIVIAKRHIQETELFCADTFLQSQDFLCKQKTDLVLLDLDLPGTNGLEGLKTIRQQFPDTALIILASDAKKELAPQSMASGAAGFILKTLPKDQLADALEQVLDGQLYQPST